MLIFGQSTRKTRLILLPVLAPVNVQCSISKGARRSGACSPITGSTGARSNVLLVRVLKYIAFSTDAGMGNKHYV